MKLNKLHSSAFVFWKSLSSLLKRFVLPFLLLPLALVAQAQWNEGGNNYTVGDLGIGIQTTYSQFHVASSNSALVWPVTINNTHNSSLMSDYGVGIKLKHGGNHESYKWGGIASIQEDPWANKSGLALYANEVEYMRVSADGNVGIGTSSPTTWFTSKTLEMYDNRPTLKINSSGSLGTIVFANDQINPSTHEGEFHLNHVLNPTTPSSSQVRFQGYPYGTVMSVQADGKVGVGNHTPREALDVSGNITFGKTSVTDFNLVSDTYGGAHAILFNAYTRIRVNLDYQ